jgi:Ser/Thr protein kinase RdoA (MazF antagonist)
VSNLVIAAQQFEPEGRVLDVQAYGEGNVNDTYLVTLDGATETHFVLQRINTHVFRRPELIMANLRVFAEHVRQRLAREDGSDRRWVLPYVLSAKDGKDYYVDSEGAFWRALNFVPRSICYQTIQDSNHAREAGYALGRFHSLISDLDAESLHDTLEGFHITPLYLRHYDEVLAGCDTGAASPDVRYCLRFIEERRTWASVLEDAKRKGELVQRPIHGDPKINNIMIDEETGHAVSIVDLDTVKPGLVHYDIGDCLRSCCNPLGEETEQLDDVVFDVDLCRAILEGYLGQTSQSMTEGDYAYLYDAIRLIAFELGLRFFTDHLEGDVYFKAQGRGHNLRRALVQFKLTESIESQETAIRTIIGELRASGSAARSVTTSPVGARGCQKE